MKHALQLDAGERIKAWLDLCDITFRLMQNSSGKVELEKRLRRMRRDDEKAHESFLSNLGKIDS